MIAEESATYFRLERIQVANEQPVHQPPGFAVVIILQGQLRIETENYNNFTLEVQTGNTLVVPHRSGKLKLSGAGELLFARPPSCS
jgi:mannose-6-phosphate isomerase class I